MAVEALQGPRSTRGTDSCDPNWLFDSSWNAADEIQLAIGQGGLKVTPLQLAVGYSAIANGGTVVTPHLVGASLSPGAPKRFRRPRRAGRSRSAEPATSVRSGLVGATHRPAGTASQVFGALPD